MSNKLTTQAYTIKRLRDCGYNVHKLDAIEYALVESRKWTILIAGGSANVFMTCYKDGKFAFYDGGAFIKANFKIDTDSIEVLVQDLNDYGIIQKHKSYGEVRPTETVAPVDDEK